MTLFATWNVNSLKMRLPRVLEFLDLHRPDVLCLQETKVARSAFPVDELASAGYSAVHHSGGRWAGVAILTPVSCAEAVSGLPGEAKTDEARWIEATVDGVRVVSVYVPNGRALGDPAYEDKLCFYEAMASRVRSLAAAGPLYVAGDMNVAVADVDVWDPSLFVGTTHTSPAERSAFAAVREAGGLVDAFRHVEPEAPGYTYWDYRAGMFHKNMGMRIDYALVTPDLAARARRCGIDRNFRKGLKPSDHAPLLLELAD